MKLRCLIVKKYSPWLLVMLAMDLFFSILLWVADIQAFTILALVLFLVTFLVFAAVLWAVTELEIKKRQAFECYLYQQTEENEEKLMELCGQADEMLVLQLGSKLRQLQYEKEKLLTRTNDYEEYVEVWAHETKTPISLLTILLDNRKEEIPQNIGRKLDYIRNRMQEYVNQMLFYARLKGGKRDYLLEAIDVRECLEDILEDYKPLLEEKEFQVHISLEEYKVYSDRRGLGYVLGQIISNAIKYIGEQTSPEITVLGKVEEKKYVLSITDNGMGVPACDLPYIFEKGFTGDSGESRKKATGMGLYIAKEMADDLKISLEAESRWKQGFEMKMTFTEV